jgi:hypothetical protein
MVHLVQLKAPPVVLGNIVTALRNASMGFYTLQEGVYLVVTNTDCAALRDWLGVLGGTVVLVTRLTGAWATRGDAALTQWIQSAGPYF